MLPPTLLSSLIRVSAFTGIGGRRLGAQLTRKRRCIEQWPVFGDLHSSYLGA
jgi:hypothetical protein